MSEKTICNFARLTKFLRKFVSLASTDEIMMVGSRLDAMRVPKMGMEFRPHLFLRVKIPFRILIVAVVFVSVIIRIIQKSLR